MRQTDHIRENRAYWDGMAADWIDAGERSWQQAEPSWGIWGLPERDLELLPVEMAGFDAVELGCGTGYVSGWMAKRGARVVGIDNSLAQLRTAHRLAGEHGIELTLAQADAETAPCPDQSFDFAISEYGAAIWCDPYRWIPEAHRLLRPGGRLTFLGNHPFAMIATPADCNACDKQLHRPYFGLHRLDWRDVEIDPGGIEFNLTISAWLELFREVGFDVLNYRELQAPEEFREDRFMIPWRWARDWPCEQVWELEKPS